MEFYTIQGLNGSYSATSHAHSQDEATRKRDRMVRDHAARGVPDPHDFETLEDAERQAVHK